MRQNHFKKLKIPKISSLTWSNERKMNSVWPDMTYSKELLQKMKILDKLTLKNI